MNKRAVLGLSANFLNIVTKKNKKTNFYPERDFPNVKIVLSTKSNIEQMNKSRKTASFNFFKKMKGVLGD